MFSDGMVVRHEKGLTTIPCWVRSVDCGPSNFEPLSAKGDLAGHRVVGQFYDIGSPRGLKEPGARIVSP